jgi:hypothetical protein
VCIDSDDFMPENAVEKIVDFWKQKGNPNVAGILGLDFFLDGKPIGGYFPEGVESLHIIDMEPKYGHYGDVKVVHRTELLKEVAPQPVFEGEKNFNPIYLFHKIDMSYPLLLLNENLCFVEYQEGGMTSGIYQQYVNSPRSFSELRRLLMSRNDVSLSFKFRQAIHYVTHTSVDRLFSFRLDEDEVHLFYHAAEAYLGWHTDKKFSTLAFLQQVME